MKDKLTLRMDREAIARAKAYAAVTGTSVSELVTRFIAALPASDAAASGGETSPDTWREDLPPATRELIGLASGSEIDAAAYKRHLLQKHG